MYVVSVVVRPEGPWTAGLTHSKKILLLGQAMCPVQDEEGGGREPSQQAQKRRHVVLSDDDDDN